MILMILALLKRRLFITPNYSLTEEEKGGRMEMFRNTQEGCLRRDGGGDRRGVRAREKHHDT
jgi:hypothetical protein